MVLRCGCIAISYQRVPPALSILIWAITEGASYKISVLLIRQLNPLVLTILPHVSVSHLEIFEERGWRARLLSISCALLLEHIPSCLRFTRSQNGIRPLFGSPFRCVSALWIEGPMRLEIDIC